MTSITKILADNIIEIRGPEHAVGVKSWLIDCLTPSGGGGISPPLSVKGLDRPLNLQVPVHDLTLNPSILANIKALNRGERKKKNRKTFLLHPCTDSLV